MGDVLKFDPSRTRSSDGNLELYERWRRASIKAQSTLDLNDAIAAGKLWAAWQNSFMADAK